MSKLHYLTGIEALNYHGADWHSFAYDFNREYPEEVRNWAGDFGVVREKDREVANPVRAFLDYLFYEIRFKRKVPVNRVGYFNFTDEEEREIEEKVETLLKPALKGEELELFKRWLRYNKGGDYEPYRPRLLEREPWKSRAEEIMENYKRFRERLKRNIK